MKSYIGKIVQMDGNECFIGIHCPKGIVGAVLGQLVIISPIEDSNKQYDVHIINEKTGQPESSVDSK